MVRVHLEGQPMLRTALIAVLLTGLASTAMASGRDRVRVVVSYDSGGYYHTGDRYYGDRYYGDRGYRDRGYDRDYRRGGRHYGYDRRWDRGRYYGRSYGWSPRSYYYGGYTRYRDSRYGHSRHCPDRWHRH
jgi:hypothetical protein